MEWATSVLCWLSCGCSCNTALSFFDGRKVTTRRAEIGVISPFLGLRPGRWVLSLSLKFPKPGSLTSLPFSSAALIASKNDSTNSLASRLLKTTCPFSSSASSALVNVLMITPPKASPLTFPATTALNALPWIFRSLLLSLQLRRINTFCLLIALNQAIDETCIGNRAPVIPLLYLIICNCEALNFLTSVRNSLAEGMIIIVSELCLSITKYPTRSE